MWVTRAREPRAGYRDAGAGYPRTRHCPPPWPARGQASLVPLWAWFGGVLGAFYVASSIVVGPRLGAAALVRLGQAMSARENPRVPPLVQLKFFGRLVLLLAVAYAILVWLRLPAIAFLCGLVAVIPAIVLELGYELARGEHDMRVWTREQWNAQGADVRIAGIKSARGWFVEFVDSAAARPARRDYELPGFAASVQTIDDYAGRPLLSVIGPPEKFSQNY